jgi:hypothetical protein
MGDWVNRVGASHRSSARARIRRKETGNPLQKTLLKYFEVLAS